MYKVSNDRMPLLVKFGWFDKNQQTGLMHTRLLRLSDIILIATLLDAAKPRPSGALMVTRV